MSKKYGILLALILFILPFSYIQNSSLYAEWGDESHFGTTSSGNPQSTITDREEIETALEKAMSKEKVEGINNAVAAFWTKIRIVLSLMSGFGSITCLVIFLNIFSKLSVMPNHPIQRRNAMIDIITAGIGTILLGGISLILGFFYGWINKFTTGYTFLSSDWVGAFTDFLINYKILVVFMFGIVSILFIFFFLKSITQFAASASNPKAKEEAMKALLFTFIGAVGTGSITIIVALFDNLLK